MDKNIIEIESEAPGHFNLRLTTAPVSAVEVNINENGIQVPSKLVNISKLRLINNATMKKSIAITKAMNIKAV